MNKGSLNSSEARKFAQEIATEAHEHYFEGGNFKQRDINHALAVLASGAAGPCTESEGTITTTQHKEKVILRWTGSQYFYEIGSFGVELNQEALSVENLEPEQRIKHLSEWIINTARRIRDQAEKTAEDKN